MSSRAGYVTMENCLWTKTLALWFGNGDEHRPLESDTTEQIVKGNLYLNKVVVTCMAVDNHNLQLELCVCFSAEQDTSL